MQQQTTLLAMLMRRDWPAVGDRQERDLFMLNFYLYFIYSPFARELGHAYVEINGLCSRVYL